MNKNKPSYPLDIDKAILPTIHVLISQAFFLFFVLFVVLFCLLAVQTKEALLTVRIHILHLTLRTNRPFSSSSSSLSVSPPPLFLCAFPLAKCILGWMNAERYCSSKYVWSGWKKSPKDKWRMREAHSLCLYYIH